MLNRARRWFFGESQKPNEAPAAPEPNDPSDDLTSFSLRMVEPIRLDTTPEQHMDLLKAQHATKRDKAKIIRAAIALALPTLMSNPSMIDMLQPGTTIDHDILAEALSGRTRIPGRQSNGARK